VGIDVELQQVHGIENEYTSQTTESDVTLSKDALD
jgi:hypothetical protein